MRLGRKSFLSFFPLSAYGRFVFLLMLLYLFIFYTVVTDVIFAHDQSSTWINEQYNASLRMLLDNIIENGTVIASPSRKEPDYYYHWIRDAAMVMGHLVHRFECGEHQHNKLILSYAKHENRLQVYNSNLLSLNLAHAESFRRLPWRWHRRTQIQRGRVTIHRTLGSTSN